jgi:hypothetical protein
VSHITEIYGGAPHGFDWQIVELVDVVRSVIEFDRVLKGPDLLTAGGDDLILRA